MKNNRIVKTLAIAAISSLTLLAGASQANSWGNHSSHFATPYAPHSPDYANFSPASYDHDASRGFKPREASHLIDSRQQTQIDKIMHGLRIGSLSQREVRKLVHEQKEIEQLQRDFLADRHLSRNEWAELDQRLDRASRNIRSEKRDSNWR
jgi:hypothetical protein